MTESEKLNLIIHKLDNLQSDMADMKTNVSDLQSDMAVMKSDMAVMKSDMAVMKSDMAAMKSDIAELQSDMTVTKSNVSDLQSDMTAIKNQINQVQLYLENKTDLNIQLLAENHSTLIDKLNQAIPVANKNLAYEVKVNYLFDKVSALEKEIADLKTRTA